MTMSLDGRLDDALPWHTLEGHDKGTEVGQENVGLRQQALIMRCGPLTLAVCGGERRDIDFRMRERELEIVKLQTVVACGSTQRE